MNNSSYDRYCQSCAMLMGITDEHFGTESDGSKSNDYCSYCYSGGKFKKDVGYKEMMEICVKFMVDDSTTEKQARRRLEKVLPTLKRWKDSEEARNASESDAESE